MNQPMETIAAIATPMGRGGIGVIRVSGFEANTIAQIILHKTLQPRKAHYGSFYDEHNQTIDQGIALFFPRPFSLTGEDILELHCHSSTVILDYLLNYILTLGARLAEPGEFLKRAFLNNKIDLSQAEAIADLISASSLQAARSAIKSLQGEFSHHINHLIHVLIEFRTFIEASIDFSEESIDFLSPSDITQRFNALLHNIDQIKQSVQQGITLKEGVQIALIGPPNVGKSSLLNRLSGRNSAIVTDCPGTTRDIIREYILIDGIPFCLVDTAGLQESNNQIEQEGIRKALEIIDVSDHLLLMIDKPFTTHTLEDFKKAPHFSALFKDSEPSIPITIVRNKIDLTQEMATIDQKESRTIIHLSAKTGKGIDLLKQHLRQLTGCSEQTENIFIARRRHLEALKKAHVFILEAKRLHSESFSIDLIAENLRQAQLALSEITGAFTPDDLLDQIFKSFCVGK